MTKKKPPEEHRKPGRPPGGVGGGPKTCENNHTANAHGQCFEATCVHYVRRGR